MRARLLPVRRADTNKSGNCIYYCINAVYIGFCLSLSTLPDFPVANFYSLYATAAAMYISSKYMYTRLEFNAIVGIHIFDAPGV